DRLIREAWLLASIQYGATRVRSGVLLLAWLSDDSLARQAREASAELSKIPPQALQADLMALVSGTSEDEAAAEPGAPAAAGDRRASRTPNLDQFTINLTAQARAGKIDPVFGRDAEVRQMVDILVRRRQNNPILTGEAGVGKTAVVEGFARRVAEGDVPPALRPVEVRTLDLGLLQAGAGVKGEF